MSVHRRRHHRRAPRVAGAAPVATARFLIGLSLVAGVLAGCGETVTTQAPPDTGGAQHPATWLEPTATNFHGTVARQSGLGGCMGCHGWQLQGKGTAPSCDHCHDMPATHHALGWDAKTQHGATVAANGAAACADCHGASFTGGSAGVSCFVCHDGPGGHPAGWSNSSSHGRYAESNGTSSCRTCHGADYRGGWSGVSSYRCHGGPNP